FLIILFFNIFKNNLNMFTFNGTITQTIFNGNTVPLTDIPNPVLDPLQAQNNIGSVIVTRILYETNINWQNSSNIPADIVNSNLTQLVLGAPGTVSVVPNIVISSGIQSY